MVVTALHYAAKELNLFELHAYFVMPNHVHILVSPAAAPRIFMHTLKRHTALQANRLLNRTGAFWQHEYYDHWIRTQDEFEKTRRYIERNPVAAGLARNPEDYRWSSAATTRGLPPAI